MDILPLQAFLDGKIRCYRFHPWLGESLAHLFAARGVKGIVITGVTKRMARASKPISKKTVKVVFVTPSSQ